MVKRGFTLVELLVVLLILGVLVGLAVPRYMQSTKTAKRTTFETNLKEITKALEDYKLQREFQGFGYPPTLESLRDSGIFNKDPINPYTGKSMLSSTSTNSGLLYQSTSPTYKLCVVQRDIEDVNNNGIVDEVLPLTTKSVCIGDMRSNIQLTFIRPSVAYTSGGTQVGVNVPRFEAGKFGQGILIERGTTNLLTSNDAQGKTQFNSNNSSYSSNTLETSFGLNDLYSLKSVQLVVTTNKGFYSPFYPTVAGDVYTFSYYVYNATSTSHNFTARLVFYDGSGNLVQIFEPNSIPVLAQQWKRISVTATAPSGSTQCRVVGWESGTISQVGDVYYFDSFQLEQKPYATSWTDGTRAKEALIVDAQQLSPTRGTISVWTKVPYLTDWNNLLYAENMVFSGQAGRFLVFVNSSGQVRFDYGINNSGVYTPAGIMRANEWYHIVARWDSTTNKMALFVNGVKYEQTLPNGVANSFTNIEVISNYSGMADNLVIYNRALTDGEIQALYQSGQPAPVSADTMLKADFDGNLDAQGGIIQ